MTPIHINRAKATQFTQNAYLSKDNIPLTELPQHNQGNKTDETRNLKGGSRVRAFTKTEVFQRSEEFVNSEI